MSAPLFQVDDQVIVDAEHHKDHGRHGVVTSVDLAKDWPVGVLVGMGLSAVIHYFREDELVPQPEVTR